VAPRSHLGSTRIGRDEAKRIAGPGTPPLAPPRDLIPPRRLTLNEPPAEPQKGKDPWLGRRSDQTLTALTAEGVEQRRDTLPAR